MVREERLVHVPAARRLAVGGAAVARLRPEVRAAEELLHQLEAFGVLALPELIEGLGKLCLLTPLDLHFVDVPGLRGLCGLRHVLLQRILYAVLLNLKPYNKVILLYLDSIHTT